MIKLHKLIFIISACTLCLLFTLCSTAFASESLPCIQKIELSSVDSLVSSKLMTSNIKSDIIKADETCNKQNIILKKGDTLELILPENNDGGYSWQLKSSLDSNILKIIDEAYIVPNASNNIYGGTRKKCWLIQTIGMGKTSINLEESRSWNTNSTLNTFSLNITVK